MTKLEEMSKDELVAALRALRADVQSAGVDPDQMALVHNLEVHELQLEMQNRQLRETQDELERSRQRYWDLYHLAPTAYLTLDREGRIEEANLTTAMLLGIARGQLIGRVLIPFVAPSDRPRFHDHLRRCLEDGAPAEARLLLVARDGPPVTVEIASVPVRDGEGRLVGCRTMMADVSAHRRIEERLALLAAASRTLGGSIEEEGGLASALTDVLKSLVPSQADVAFVDIVAGEGFQRFQSGGLPGAIAAGRPTGGYPAPPLSPDSPQHRVVESGDPILIPACSPGSLSGADGIVHETAIRTLGPRSLLYLPLTSRSRHLGVLTLISVDERRRFTGVDLTFGINLASRMAAAVDNDALYRSAAVAVRAREDVLSFVAHDLRGLLNGIQLTVELMVGKAPAEGKERRRGWIQLERVQRVTEQMSRMIDDIQDVTSFESGQLTFEMANLIVDDLVIQTRDLFVSAAAAKGIDLEARLTNRAIGVRGDATRAVRVLGNLVGNAIKFTPPGGSVTISSSVANRHVLFSVRDTGVGVAGDQLPRLFDRYWQADAAAHKGRGLGLFIARRLVEAHGGTIWAESQLGAGTTMFFTLPRSSPGETSLKERGAEERRAEERGAEERRAEERGTEKAEAELAPAALERR